MASLSGVVLCGGYSRRMKQDKSRIHIIEQEGYMLERAVQCMSVISPALDAIVISCREDTVWNLPYKHVVDTHKNIGPIAGIYASLLAIGTDCITMPVDVPLMQTKLLEELRNVYMSVQDSGVLMVSYATSCGKIESLLSIFSYSALPYIEKSIAKGCYRIVKAIPEEKQHHIIYDKEVESFYNVNTPEDIPIVRSLLEQKQLLQCEGK